MNGATGVNDGPAQPVVDDDLEGRLRDAQGDVERCRGELREALDARDALVFEAVDRAGKGQRWTARALGVQPQNVVRILANGPPTDGHPSAHPEMP